MHQWGLTTTFARLAPLRRPNYPIYVSHHQRHQKFSRRRSSEGVRKVAWAENARGCVTRQIFAVVPADDPIRSWSSSCGAIEHPVPECGKSIERRSWALPPYHISQHVLWILAQEFQERDFGIVQPKLHPPVPVSHDMSSAIHPKGKFRRQ